MIVTLTGDNTLALGDELAKLVGAFESEHGDLALERIDCEEAEFAQIQAALTSLPFLSSKKMVILRSPSTNKQFVEQSEQLLSDVPETTEVILIESKLDKRQSYYKFLKKETDFHEFSELDLNGLASWVVAEAKQKKGEINSSDARYLAERIGLNQQMLGNELEKLILYNPKVTRQTIDLLTDATPQSTIFQLLDAAFAGNTRHALELYKEQRAMKVEPVQIVAMISWQLNVLAIVKTAGDRPAQTIAKEAKINPYVVTKSQGIARKLSLAELKTLVKDLLDIDTKSKSTNLDTDEALQHYILKLAQ